MFNIYTAKFSLKAIILVHHCENSIENTVILIIIYLLHPYIAALGLKYYCSFSRA